MSKILVHSKRPGFRRGGIEFGADPVELDTDELTKAQRRQIEAEPMLIVEQLPEDTASATAKGGAAGKSAGATGKSAGAESK